jgi:putative hydrolase of the HAD superfamily
MIIECPSGPKLTGPREEYAIFVDLDETLVNYDDALGLAFMQMQVEGLLPAHPSSESLLQQWKSLRRAIVLNGDSPLDEQRWHRASRFLASFSSKRQPSPREVSQFVDILFNRALSHCRLYPDVRELLETQQLNLLGIVTNGDQEFQLAKLNAASWPLKLPLFASMSVGFAKPDPRLFNIVASVMGLKPTRCIMIGDSIRLDVIPSMEAGWVGVHCNRRRTNPSLPTGAVRISSFHELLSIWHTG